MQRKIYEPNLFFIMAFINSSQTLKHLADDPITLRIGFNLIQPMEQRFNIFVNISIKGNSERIPQNRVPVNKSKYL